jgi:hypothetical protein
MKVRLEFKPQDCWIGAFWKTKVIARQMPQPLAATYIRGDVVFCREVVACDLWLCIIPTLPLHFEWERLTRWKRTKIA